MNNEIKITYEKLLEIIPSLKNKNKSYILEIVEKLNSLDYYWIDRYQHFYNEKIESSILPITLQDMDTQSIENYYLRKKKENKVNLYKKIVKAPFRLVGLIIGIIFILVMIASWLRFFGIIETKPPTIGEPPCEPNYMGSCDPR